MQDGAPADVDVGPPLGGARVGVDVAEPPGSSLMINGGSLEKRTWRDVRRRDVPSANFTLYDR